MNNPYKPLSPHVAQQIYDILVRKSNAPEKDREKFVTTQTQTTCHEWHYNVNNQHAATFKRSYDTNREVETWTVDLSADPTSHTLYRITILTNIALNLLKAKVTHDS